MRIAGVWLSCDDNAVRPVVRVNVHGAGVAASEFFLIDTGADQTVLSPFVFAKLGLPTVAAPAGLLLTGVGGSQQFVVVETVLEFTAEDGSPARIRGQYPAFTDAAAMDISILGRDILDHFDLIVSKRKDELYLLATNHGYRIEQV
jgi:hypothetical protein